jgi:ParB family transcriptional regulator, chromosome partitioning protein
MNGEPIQEIAIDLIDSEPQVRERFREESLEELMSQIKRHGLLQPIVLRRVGNRFKVVFGGRRLLASKRAGCRTIPARIIETDLSEGDAVLQQLIENCHEDLTPLEWAKGIARAMEAKKMTARQAAAEVGFSETRVSNSLALLKLPEWIQKLVEEGRIACSAASRLARIEDTEKQAEHARQLADGKLTRDSLCGAMKATRTSGEKSASTTVKRVTAVLGAGRSVTVTAAGLDLEEFIRALEELTGRARKVRPRGIALPTFIRMLREESKTQEVENVDA